MNKSMYSLILMDDVIREIDRLAYSEGTSRSGMINQILADRVSILTPKKRIAQVLSSLADTLEEGGSVRIRQTTASALLLKSALNFRYNPTIHYNVEMTVEKGRYECLFKVASRTKSDALLSRLNIFFELWLQIEANMLAGEVPDGLQGSVSGGCYKRRFSSEHKGEPHDPLKLGKALGAYVRLFDGTLKCYFDAEHGVDMETFQKMTNMYQEFLQQAEIVL